MEKNEQPINTNENTESTANDATHNASVNNEENTDVADVSATEEGEDSDNNESTVSESNANGKKRKRGGRGGDGNGQKVKELEADIEKMTSELSEMKDKYLRLYAEFDNYRKRTSRELIDMQKVASQSVVKALLSTLDDFERAIKAAEQPNSTEVIPEGVKLVHNKLVRTLEQQGLKAMESTGTTFDSDLHEAITKIPVPTEELKGKVIDTVECGYYLNDKIIRYAKVVVGQ